MSRLELALRLLAGVAGTVLVAVWAVTADPVAWLASWTLGTVAILWAVRPARPAVGER